MGTVTDKERFDWLEEEKPEIVFTNKWKLFVGHPNRYSVSGDTFRQTIDKAMKYKK